MLSINGVSKRFGTVPVLNDVAAQFRPHAVNFLAGPNGAGKTTLIKCILGLHRYDGEITWDGAPLDPAERRVYPVFDDAPFHGRLTGRQNLLIFSPESIGGRSSYLSGEILRRRVKGYSHGERMRLALTSALNSGSEIIILDEPTNGLDRETMARLKSDIRMMTPSTTFLVADHNLEFYDDVIDHLFLLKEGKIAETGFLPPFAEGGTTLAHLYEEHFPTASH